MGKRGETERRLWELLQRLKEKKIPVTVTEFIKLGEVSRSYIYRFHELSAAVAEYAKETQPKRSRRGAGAKIGEAKKRDISEQMRREHAQWARDIPNLERKIKELTDEVENKDREKQKFQNQADRLRRLVELLLLLASEAGVSPSELEEVKKKAG